MADLTDEVRKIVEQVLKSPEIASLLGEAPQSGAPTGSAAGAGPRTARLGAGIFTDIDSMVAAAAAAQRALSTVPLETRARMIAAMRRAMLDNNEALSTEAVSETGLGNVTDKKLKNALAAEKRRAWRMYSPPHIRTSMV